jgi:hypothetical protein
MTTKRWALVSNSQAVIVIEADTAPEGVADWREVGADVQIGHRLTNGAWLPPRVVAVSPSQARLALLAAGKLDQVAPAIAAMPLEQRTAAQLKWEYASEVRRDDALVIALAAALSLSEQQIDELFAAAAAIQ